MQETIPKERSYIESLIGRIIREAPKRKPTSEDERKAQLIMKAEFEKLGLTVGEHRFMFNDNLYKNIALHFGIGSFSTLIGGLMPPVALIGHLLAAGSYWADSTRKGYLLRRLLRFKPSQNIMGVLPAKAKSPALRLVFLAHADAAFTGLLFDPKFVQRFSGELPPKLQFMKRSMELATKTQFALAGADALRMILGPFALPLRPIEAILTLPAVLAFLLNMQIVLRNEIVPGANDDLSGVAALPVLAERLMKDKPEDVEIVFAVTGCEEASLGGADALAKDMEGVWEKENTVIIALDGLAGGGLHFAAVEGEVCPMRIPEWLSDVALETAKSEPRFGEVKGFEIPVGATDVAAFLARGFEGVALICVDETIGAPENYHVPADTLENLDIEKVLFSIDFAERFARNIIAARLQ